MGEYTKVTIEIGQSTRSGRLQLSINAFKANGGGDGYRLHGTKFAGGTTVMATTVLDDRDVAAIRRYLAIWDEIHAGEEASA